MPIASEMLVLIADLLLFKMLSLEWAIAVKIALASSDLLVGGFLFIYLYGFTNSLNILEVLAAIMVLIATHSFRAS